MPQTYAQEHALSRRHAGRNPRVNGAPKHVDDEGTSVSGLNEQPDAASETGGAGTIRRPDCGAASARTPEAGQGASTGSQHERQDPATESDLEHPKPAHHNDNEKSKLPERDDEARKQAPNDRPGKKSGEGETPVG